MFSNRLAFAALAVGCLGAAGLGGYLASRQKVVTPETVSAAPAQSSSAAQAVRETPAQNTEITASNSAVKPVSAPVATASLPAVAKRTEAAPARPAPAKPVPQPNAGVVAQNDQAPVFDRPSPSGSPAQASEGSAPVVTPADLPTRQELPRLTEPPAAPEPQAKAFEELVIAPNSVVGLQMESAITSERAKVEDRVEARVVRDVRVGREVAIPAGSRAVGSVMVVERGSKFRDRARLGIRFHTLVLADGTQLPISTETIYRFGEAPGNGSAAKVGGGAVAGAILGAILGGSKGAAIGGAAGAGAGTAAVMAGDVSAATFSVGTDVTARFISPVTVTVER